jgi:hypothetical protein
MRSAVVFIIVSALSATVEASSSSLPPDCEITGLYLPPSGDFDQHVQPIFDTHCVQCHQPDANRFDEHLLDLREGLAYRSLVGIPSRSRPDMLLVARHEDNWARSYLWQKIGCPQISSGERMPPPPAPALNQADRMLIEGWIMRGAAPGSDGDGRSLPVQLGMTGSWYDPTASGQGFMLEVVPGDPGLLALLWTTFAEGFSAPGQADPSRQRWMFALGTFMEGDSIVEMEVLRSTRGGFDAYNRRAETELLGTARLRFHSCREATFFYDIHADGDPERPRQRHISLRRLTPNVLCEDPLDPETPAGAKAEALDPGSGVVR